MRCPTCGAGTDDEPTPSPAGEFAQFMQSAMTKKPILLGPADDPTTPPPNTDTEIH